MGPRINLIPSEGHRYVQGPRTRQPLRLRHLPVGDRRREGVRTQPRQCMQVGVTTTNALLGSFTLG